METNAQHTSSPRFPLSPSLTLNRKRFALLIGFGILTLVLLLGLGGGREAIAALAHVNWRLVALAILIHYSGFAVRGLRWQQLLRTMGHQLTWRFVTML